MSEYNTILLAVIGTSPGVLTETVWALINDNDSIIPNEIVILTTTEGKRVLKNELLDSGVWKKFISTCEKKYKINSSTFLRFGSSASIKVFPSADGTHDLNDITTASDSQVVADYIIETLRIYSEVPDTRIVASIAGGRKTMGALLSLGMTLLGRTQDKLCHVLVSSPYDTKLSPNFFYPEQNAIHHSLNGKEIASANAQINLIDIPFVRMRGWNINNFVKNGTSYMSLVEQFCGIAPPAVVFPEVYINMQKGIISVHGINIPASSKEFAVFIVFIADRLNPTGQLLPQKILADKLLQLSGAPDDAVWFHDFQEKIALLDYCENEDERVKEVGDTIRKSLSSMRSKLKKAGVRANIIHELLPVGQHSIYNYPAEKFTFEGAEWYNDLPMNRDE